jgi:hypothetical protein
MTHFLFLEKGARVRDADRASAEKAGRRATPSRRRRGEAANPGFLLLMLPSTDGYRVLKASLEEVIEIPAADLGGEGRTPDARLLQRLLEATSAEIGGMPRRAGRSRNGASAAGRVPREAFGEVEIDIAARVVTALGAPIALAPLEFDLLVALVRRDGAAASRRELLREVWGTSKPVSLRTVDTHIANLRRKIEADAARPRHILTVKKVGYRLAR